MPTYEYACDKCGHEFEREQRITDDPVKTCPECRGRKVRRLISSTSFVLKGSGWYSDLYSSKKPDKKSEKKSDSGSDSGDGGDKSKSDAAGKSEKKESGGKAKSKKPAKKASG